jgi:hypothetical protein
MTKTEREELKRLARERARVAKADAERRSADLKASFEYQVATYYEYDRDEVWRAAVEAAKEAVEDAVERIEERCVELGIPRELAPTLSVQWVGRGPHAVASRQTELRRVANKRIEAMERSAKHEIDRQALEIQTQLVRAGLTSAEAVAFLEGMPSVDSLMPALDVRELTEGTGRPPDPDDDDIVF